MVGCGSGQGGPTPPKTVTPPNIIVPPLAGIEGGGLIPDPLTDPMTALFNNESQCSSIWKHDGLADQDQDSLSTFLMSDLSDFLHSLPPQDPFGMSQQQMQPQVATSLMQAQPQVVAPSQLAMTKSINLYPSEKGVESSFVNVDKFSDDGYSWRKYGEKLVKDFLFARSYYMCTHQDCPAKKNVVRSLDGIVTEINYKENHTHQPPHPSELTKNESSKVQESRETTVQHMSGTSDRKKVHGHEVVEKNYEPNTKRRNTRDSPLNIPTSSHSEASNHIIVVKTVSDVDILDDGFRWRKYGQKFIKCDQTTRSYYKCTTPDCVARKHVEREPFDLRVVITTYEGKHNHCVPPSKTMP